MSRAANPICVALDFADEEMVRSTANAVAPFAGVFKVGLTALYGAGTDLVGDLAKDRPVFVDAKLHDIPAQVEGAMTSIAELGASYVTVHAAGGFDMVKAAVGAAGAGLEVLAVTVLTSLDDAEVDKLGFAGTTEDGVLRLAERALDAGAHGLVCSPLELAALRGRFGDAADLVVPGIRPAGAGADDQRRTLGPREALDAGATLLVVGRPITAAVDPATAARRMLESIAAR
ncbi:MAG: orotidine-5'-phosphate decarboxylase [Actinobacteria bacterium]|nr:orotidine-5'-phosphate decarboxylase [Actinomycetota bacterium]